VLLAVGAWLWQHRRAAEGTRPEEARRDG
jgi:hypothetical protein